MKPLITTVGDHHVLWVEAGRGWLLDLYEVTPRWEPLDHSAHHVTYSGRGRILKASEVFYVTSAHGRPKELMS